jgi:prepilin-type N-terminal cleavage/methylation domain-containing protein
MIVNLINKLQQSVPGAAGFTLIEMLVAVLLLTTAVAGPMTIASRGITASVVAKDQVVAFNLAQDAVEYIRHQRDTNTLSGNSWLAGIGGSSAPGGCESANGCLLDSTGNQVTTAGSEAVRPCTTQSSNICALRFQYNTATNRFTYIPSSGNTSVTLFRRHVKMTALGPDEVQLEVRVIWCYQNTANNCVTDPNRKEVVVRENLLNWQ